MNTAAVLLLQHGRTNTSSFLTKHLERLLQYLAGKTKGPLYVTLEFDEATGADQIDRPSVERLFDFIEYFYTTNHSISKDMDVRIVLDSLKAHYQTSTIPDSLHRSSLSSLNRLLLLSSQFFVVPRQHDCCANKLESSSSLSGRTIVAEALADRFSVEDENSRGFPQPEIVPMDVYGPTEQDRPTSNLFLTAQGCQSTVDKLGKYSGVVLGGTFDRLHNGHKILLSAAALLARDKLTIGVTDGDMLKSKIMHELIEPVEERITAVTEFLTEVDPSLELKIVPIVDPFGPSTVDTDLDCIIASKETTKGALKVVEVRKEKGLEPLDVYIINLADERDSCPEFDENKISSSKLRCQQLGLPLRQLPENYHGIRPVVIGLTGGIASGKSHVAKYLEGLGAALVDCDKLGHATYRSGTQCYTELVSMFGDGIVDSSSQEIDRKALGSIVFADPDQMRKLNQIVWPEIARLAQERIALSSSAVVVLDAAVLLEAGWDCLCHEVWAVSVPQKEAVKRLHERNNLSEAEALKRLNSQLSPTDRIKKSHVVFCSLWDYSITQAQVNKAWKRVQEAI